VEVREPLANILGLGAALDSQATVHDRVEELLARVGLERYRDAFVSELSTGTRRMVELAGALAHEPRVLLLDEPSSGIAQRESEALGELLRSVRDRTGASLVVIEHDIPLVSSLADRLVCLHLGSVIAEGDPRDVLGDDGVVAAYLGTDDMAIARSG
jgi:branched-chain amino acid transport system ATP-binding protein